MSAPIPLSTSVSVAVLRIVKNWDAGLLSCSQMIDQLKDLGWTLEQALAYDANVYPPTPNSEHPPC